MTQAILDQIRQLLTATGVTYDEAHHDAVRTAQEAADARGCPVEIGAKSIVMKTDDVFRLFVLSGASAMGSRLVRKHLGVRRTRFAIPAELAELTGGLEPGAVPPFGHPILPLELFVDPGLLEHDQLAFTPGVHTVSILMASSDWRKVAQPEVFRFARAPQVESGSVR
jgi:Ala-tRNA(Pro) deacylase